jgi:RNA polymerase sigma-70 factor (ECF subfamily)
MRAISQGEDAEARFAKVFRHLGELTAYARRRGSPDPASIAAEAMTIAWRKLADVPSDDARPWLFATARNLLLVEWRQRALTNTRHAATEHENARDTEPELDVHEIDSELLVALRSLTPEDREALLLIAWEDLSPALAAKAIGISQTTFRVRLHRARRRLQSALAAKPANPSIHRLEVEEQ